MKSLPLLLVSVLATASSVVMRKMTSAKIPPVQYEAVTGLLHATLGAALYLSLGDRWRSIEVGSYGAVGAQALFSFLAAISFSYGIRAGALGPAAAVMAASPVVTMALSAMLFGERPEMRTLLGTALVVAGTVIVSLR